MGEFFGNIAASFKKVSKYVWALVILLVVFFTTQFCVMGNFRNTGDCVTAMANKQVCYKLEFAQGQTKLDDVYINLGSIYVKAGEDVGLTVRTSTSSSSNPTWSIFDSATIGNIYSTKGISGANFNWVAVATDKAKSSIKAISFTFDENVVINEIVCRSENGSKIKLTPLAAASSGYTAKALEAAVDAQNSFTTKTTAKYVFSQEEAFYLTSIHALRTANQFYEGSVYRLDADFTAVGSLLMLPSVAMFGNSTFALRLPSLVATTVMLVFIFLLGSELFKDKKYGLLFAVIFAFGGLATSVGTYGTVHAIVTSALVGGLYFMYRFYAKGISNNHVVRDSMNILISSLYCALAVAIEAVAGAPAIGIVVLFVFGMIRQHKAYKLALEKTNGQEETKTNENGETVVYNRQALKVKKQYNYKVQVCISLCALGCFVGCFMILLLAGIFAYPAYVAVYDSAEAHTVSFASLVVRNFLASGLANNSTLYTAGNATNVFAWFLPIKASTVYSATANGTYIARTILPNFALTLISFVCLLAVTAKVVYDFVKKNSDKQTLRIRRIYFVLFGGMIAAMLSALIKGDATTVCSYSFSVMYAGFFPLAILAVKDKFTKLGKDTCEKCANLTETVVCVCLAAIVVSFALSIPAIYGFALSQKVAKGLFGWMSFISNGFFR